MSESIGADPVEFHPGRPANLMAIDGTWRRSCVMDAASESGARLTMSSSIEGLKLIEFFLVLSSSGPVYRRCELVWVNGDQIGVNFLKKSTKAAKARS